MLSFFLRLPVAAAEDVCSFENVSADKNYSINYMIGSKLMLLVDASS